MIPLRNAKRFFAKALRQPGYAFSVFNRRALANLYYWLADGTSSYPEAVTLFLTYKCNLQCKMCGQWGESGITRKKVSQEELSLIELKGLIEELASFRPNITLFGGEPLLHPSCVEIIRYIKEKDMHALMITNGVLLDNLAEDLVASGLDELNVSLDGGKQLHDEIRGVPGVFDKIMKGLKQIQYFKNKKGSKKPLINLQSTISQYNYQQLEQLLAVANEAEVDSLTFHNLIFLTKEVLEKQQEFDRLLNCASSDWEGFVFESEINPELLYKKMREILSGSYSFNIDFYPNFSFPELKAYYQDGKYSGRCLSPWMTAYIFPDGEVRPCLNFDYSYGNIKRNRFTELWNNEKAVKFRSLVKKNKLFPVCVRCTELYRY